MSKLLTLNRSVTLRAVTSEDDTLLARVYAGTRAAELAAVSWTEDEKAAFVQMQFAAQAQYYRGHYPDTSFDVILLGAEAVGRLYVSRWTDELRIVDIALLPEYCNRGIGTTLLRGLQSAAAAAGKPLRIHVERFNPALRLYERLGFRQIADRGVYLFMEWRG
jgi:ribosomal protein S18 acetylase RimI-like enzyme